MLRGRGSGKCVNMFLGRTNKCLLTPVRVPTISQRNSIALVYFAEPMIWCCIQDPGLLMSDSITEETVSVSHNCFYSLWQGQAL